MKWENSEGGKTCMNSYPIVAEANASVDAAVEAEEDNMGKNENTFDPHILFLLMRSFCFIPKKVI